MTNKIGVEIAYATPESQKILTVEVKEGTTAYQAAVDSGISKIYPEINFESAELGIFGNALGARGLPEAKEYLLKEGDRVEIYRPLIADPKEVRKKRAVEAAERRAQQKKA